MAEKTVFSLSQSSLAALGILDETYDFYLSLKEYCEGIFEENKEQIKCRFLGITAINSNRRIYIDGSKADNIREMCREEFRRRLSAFCNEYFMYFATANPTKHISDLDLRGFWWFWENFVTLPSEDERGKQSHLWGFHASYMAFSTFIKNVEYYIACAIRTGRLDEERALTVDDVLEEINFRIDVIVKLKKESALRECANDITEPIDIYVFKSLHTITCSKSETPLPKMHPSRRKCDPLAESATPSLLFATP